ncbi:hypothetical protein [Calothrix sp. UHCC 0171]|uniref:hypothetical protein n=1 Tax=Calothrix sp. UHCC 0171 TaxID=3110245 RepID=UPI002B1EECD1|nr:hypothetical protein [Calothrix sp. UHCC 0171]MEA5574442.1 hypothetical protein [Calothrix sp. UHCC 0171]
MIFDFINGLFDLWQQLENHQNSLVQTGVNQTEIRIKNTLPCFDKTNKIGQNLDAIAEVSLSILETFDTASLEQLIQKLPQVEYVQQHDGWGLPIALMENIRSWLF